MGAIRQRRVLIGGKPAQLVGRKEAAAILGVKAENLIRDFPELPPPLQARGIDGFEVGQTPLWPRGEIEDIAKSRAKAA